MRGEFDDLLKWPFRGDITIQLLNQEEDKDHIEKVFTPDDDANRVERTKSPSVHSSHFYCLERGYLKNDCLKFCITKVALS